MAQQKQTKKIVRYEIYAFHGNRFSKIGNAPIKPERELSTTVQTVDHGTPDNARQFAIGRFDYLKTMGYKPIMLEVVEVSRRMQV